MGHSAVSLHMLCHHARGYAKKRFHTVQKLSGWVIQHIHRFARDLHAWGQVPLHAHHGQLSRAQDIWPVHRLVFALRPTPPDKLRYGSRQSK